MSYKCSICAKRPVAGFSYSHSNLGSKRIFRPNLQKQKIVVAGRTRSVYVCTRCIKSGRAVRPTR